MDERRAEAAILALEAIAANLHVASTALIRVEYASMRTWGAARFVRMLVGDVDAAAREVGSTCLGFAAVPEGEWVAAARLGVYRARCRLEEARFALCVYLGVAPTERREADGAPSVVARMRIAVTDAARALRRTRWDAPAGALSLRDAGRVITAMLRIVSELEVTAVAVSRVALGTPDELSLGALLATVKERFGDARLALMMASTEVAKVVAKGSTAPVAGPPELRAVRRLLGVVCSTVPDLADVGPQAFAVWLSGRAGPARLGELAGALRSVETMVAFLEHTVGTRWPRGDGEPVLGSGRTVGTAASYLGVAARAKSEFPTVLGLAPGALAAWQGVVQRLAEMGERGVSVTCEDAVAELSGPDVAVLFDELAAVVRTIAPVVSMIGASGVVSSVGWVDAAALLKLTVRLGEAATQLEREGRRVAEAERVDGGESPAASKASE